MCGVAIACLYLCAHDLCLISNSHTLPCICKLTLWSLCSVFCEACGNEVAVPVWQCLSVGKCVPHFCVRFSSGSLNQVCMQCVFGSQLSSVESQFMLEVHGFRSNSSDNAGYVWYAACMCMFECRSSALWHRFSVLNVASCIWCAFGNQHQCWMSKLYDSLYIPCSCRNTSACMDGLHGKVSTCIHPWIYAHCCYYFHPD